MDFDLRLFYLGNCAASVHHWWRVTDRNVSACAPTPRAATWRTSASPSSSPPRRPWPRWPRAWPAWRGRWPPLTASPATMGHWSRPATCVRMSPRPSWHRGLVSSTSGTGWPSRTAGPPAGPPPSAWCWPSWSRSWCQSASWSQHSATSWSSSALLWTDKSDNPQITSSVLSPSQTFWSAQFQCHFTQWVQNNLYWSTILNVCPRCMCLLATGPMNLVQYSVISGFQLTTQSVWCHNLQVRMAGDDHLLLTSNKINFQTFSAVDNSWQVLLS